MPRYEITSPDGRKFEVTAPEGAAQDEVLAYAQANFGAAPTPESGFFPAIKAGVSGVKEAGYSLLGRTGVMDEAAAEKAIAEEQAYQRRTFAPTQKGWTEDPLTKLAELGGQSLPYIAAPIVAGGAAALGGAPALAGMGAAGLASAAQFTGTNLVRQMERDKRLGETELGSAFAAAIPQAALDMIGFKMIPGIRKIFADAGKEITEDAARKIATSGTANIAKEYVKATGKAMGAEGVTEAGQQFFERLQAGLSIGDEAARDEYWDSLIGGAVLGGMLAPAGHYVERGQAIQAQRVQEAKKRQEEAAAAQQAYETPTPEQLAEFDAIEAVRQREAAMRELEGTVPVEPLQQVETRPPEYTAAQTGMEYAQPGETLDMFAGMQGTPTPEVTAPVQAEAPAAPFATVLTPDVLKSTGLKPQSGFFKKLLNKDMADPVQQKEVADVLTAVRANPNLSANTKAAIERVAMQAFGALATQQEMFGPRGGVLTQPKPPRAAKIEKEVPSPPAFEEAKREPTTATKQRGRGAGVAVPSEPSGIGLDATTAGEPAAPVGTGLVPAGPDVVTATGTTEVPAATLTTETQRATDAAKATMPTVQEKAQPKESVPDEELGKWMSQFESDMLAPDKEKDEAGNVVYKASEGAGVRESIRTMFSTQDKAEYGAALNAIASAERAPEVSKKATAKVEPVANRVRTLASNFMNYAAQFDPDGVKAARAHATSLDAQARRRVVTQQAEKAAQKEAAAAESKRKIGAATEVEAVALEEERPEQKESAYWSEPVRSYDQPTTAKGKAKVEKVLADINKAFEESREEAPAGKKRKSRRDAAVTDDARPGIASELIQTVVNNYRKLWKGMPQVHVVSLSELGPEAREIAKTKRGMYTVVDGKPVVVLIQDNIKSTSMAAATLFHEVLGHYGLNVKFREELDNVLRAIYDTNAEMRKRADAWMEANPNAYLNEDRPTRAVEEVLALMSEGGKVKQGLISRFKEIIRRFARKMGMKKLGYSDAEVMGILRSAHEAAMKGGDVSGTAKERFATAAAPTTPASWNNLVNSSAIMQGKPGVVQTAFKKFMGSVGEVGVLDTLRKYIADAAAPVATKIDAAFDGKVRDALGRINPLGQYRQAADYSKLLISFFELGGLKKDPTTNQYVVEAIDGIPSMKQVAEALQAWGEANGLSFEDAYAHASKMIEAVRHAEMMKADPTYQPNKLSNADPRSAKDQIAEGVRLYNSIPEIRQIAGMMDKIRYQLIDKMVAVGRISKDEGQFWKDASGYIPFDRIEDFDTTFRSLRRSGTGVSQLGGLPKFIGSTEREVANVFDNFTKLNGWMIGQVLKQDANTSMLKTMERLGYAKAPVRADSARGRAVEKNKRVKLYVDGVEHVVELESQYDQSAFSELPVIKSAWIKALGSFSNVLRTTITAMPPFAIKQVTDDVQRAFFTSGVQHPSALIIPSLRNFFAISVAELRGTRHQYLKDFGKLGIVGEYDFNSSNPAETMLQDFGFRQRGWAKKMFHKLEGITRASDLAVRKAIYDQTMKETQDKALALTRAREFINFRRHGAGGLMPALTSTVPFYNAYIQGMDVLLRAATGKDSSMAGGQGYARAMFIKRAVQLTAFSTIYAMAMGDDDDYKEMDIRTRSNNWILPGGYKLSVPGEIGSLYKVPAEMALEFWRRQGTPEQMEASEAAITALRMAGEQYVGRAVPVPAAVKPVLEAMTNYSFFSGRQLIGTYHKELAPSLQKSERTSELAVAISNFSRDVVGVDKISPILVDNFLQGYLGSVAALTQLTTDKLLNPNRLDRPIYKYWMLGNYMYDPIGARRLTEFYDVREDAVRVQNSLREMMKSDPDHAEQYALDHESELAMASAINGTLESLHNTREYKKYLASNEAAKEMTQEERQKAIEETRKYEQQLVGWVREVKAEMAKSR